MQEPAGLTAVNAPKADSSIEADRYLLIRSEADSARIDRARQTAADWRQQDGWDALLWREDDV